jgi:hypothetical protein
VSTKRERCDGERVEDGWNQTSENWRIEEWEEIGQNQVKSSDGAGSEGRNEERKKGKGKKDGIWDAPLPCSRISRIHNLCDSEW